MPVDNERRVGMRCSTVIFIHTGMCNDQTTDGLPGKSPVCDLNLGKVCSLIIWELDRGEHWDKVKKKKTCHENENRLLHTDKADQIRDWSRKKG